MVATVLVLGGLPAVVRRLGSGSQPPNQAILVKGFGTALRINLPWHFSLTSRQLDGVIRTATEQPRIWRSSVTRRSKR